MSPGLVDGQGRLRNEDCGNSNEDCQRATSDQDKTIPDRLETMLPSISSSWYQGSIVCGAALERGKALGHQIIRDRRRHVVDMTRTVLLETDTLDAAGGLFDDANSQRYPGATRATTRVNTPRPPIRTARCMRKNSATLADGMMVVAMLEC
jgi:hypothetical protein